jgi:hypothetical protein
MSPRSASERLRDNFSPASASLDANHSQTDSLAFARERRSDTFAQALPVKKIGACENLIRACAMSSHEHRASRHARRADGLHRHQSKGEKCLCHGAF